MEHDREAREDEDEELLQSNTAHVDVDTKLQGLGFDVCSGHNHTATKLHQKCKNIQPDEISREAIPWNMEEFLFGKVKVDHATEHHVVKCIDHWKQT